MILPAWIYLLVGILVAYVSSYIDGFGIFIVVGILFMAVGVVKIIGSFAFKKEIEHPTKKHIDGYNKCDSCGAYNYKHVDKCHFCGKML